MLRNDMSDELKVAIEAAKKASDYAIRFFDKELKTEKKYDDTVVSRIDREVEEIIRNTILDKFSDARFVGEEVGGIPNKGRFWTIDPIDGTRHFTRHTPLWATLISFVVNEKPVVGVSSLPGLNELLYAEKGRGAFINHKRVNVSKISTINDALLMFGSIRFFKDKTPLLRLVDKCASSRGFVSPYEMHLLASGRCEIVLDAYGKIWDIAPFRLIIEEAGGKVTGPDGKPWSINTNGALATNRILHDEVVAILNKTE